MAEGVPRGWLPPTAPGAGPVPRFDTPPEQPQETPAQPPAGGPTFVRSGAAGTRERNATAVWALVLGVTALALLLLSFGSLFVLTLPCSVGAWVLAARARKQLEGSPGQAGAGQAVAALWLGRIGVIAGVAAMVVFVALIAAGFDFEQFRLDLENELDQRRERQGGGGGGGGDAVRTGLEQLRAAVTAWRA
jgi:hypothetical protein